MSRLAKLFHYAVTVRSLVGKSFLQQIIEIFQLAIGSRRLGVSEYYELGIFDDRVFAPVQKLNCVGWRASAAIDKRLNDDYWRATANDKVLNYALLQQYGLPMPETVATFSKQHRRIGKEHSLVTEHELEMFLTNDMQFPVFIKPIHGTYGRGTFLLVAFEVAGRHFVDSQGKKVAMDELMRSCLIPQFGGMLFQKCLQPHTDVEAWVGATTSCVRVIVALSALGPTVHMAFWKVARAHNITDNFHMGATGNLLAWVNKNTGRIERVVSGMWPHGEGVTHHPDTKQVLLGQTLPDWPQAIAMCLSAATCFPGLKLQHWDVAFCQGGPVLMELNTEADLGVPQFLGGTPFVDETIGSML
jgi:hypothetical protein